MRPLSFYWILGYLISSTVLGLELTLEPDELVKAQRESSGGFYFYDSNGATLMFNRSLFVYREKMYGEWSKWSDCSPHTCLQHRYRRCVDDSYTQPTNYLTSAASVCPFKYIAEERPCEDQSTCIINAQPSEDLIMMQNICGKRKSSSRNVKTATPSPKTSDEIFEDTEAIEEDELNRHYLLKIMGERTARAKNWPWHVAIYKAANYNASEGLTRLKSENVICGGTLITPRWVLTAAHCLKPIFGSSSQLPLGIPTQIDTPDMKPITLLVRAGDTVLEGTRTRNEYESDHVVNQVVIHPDWVPRRVNSPFDVALLRLETPVDIDNDGVGVACLPDEENVMPTEESLCYAVGWGDNCRSSLSPRHRRPTFFNPFFWPIGGRYWQPTRSRRRSNALQEVKVNIDPPEKCFHHDDENDAQICAGNSKAVVCAGDTGSGLFCRDDSNGKWYVHGVMGSGPTQGSRSHRWLYNSVESVKKWIYRYAT